MSTTTYTLHGDKQLENEDWYAATNDVMIVLDGATIRTETGCIHGLPWYVRQLGAALLAGAQDSATPLREVLSSAIRQVSDMHRSSCDLSHPGTPSAAVGIARRGDGQLDWLVLGDITIMASTSDRLTVVVDDRVSRTALDERRECDQYLIGTDAKLAAILAMKDVELASRNVEGGYWIASVLPEAADHAHAGSTALADVWQVAVCSDGAMRALDLTDLTTYADVMQALQTDGPQSLVERVRHAEREDPQGALVPRNKATDDATALFADWERHETAAQPSIAAAVVLGTSGLLVGRRHDDTPPWTLIAGEVEPGEQPADTAVREVKEETGLEVSPAVEIGRRIHPRTGRLMVYLACTPVREADEPEVYIGDPAELADVRWVSRGQVTEYLPDLYEPVQRYIAQE